MRSDQLTGDQLEALRSRFAPMLEYLGRLERWMHQRKFEPDDPLTALVAEAKRGMHDICAELHNHMVDGPVGSAVRPPKSIMSSNSGDALGRKPRK